MKTNKDIKERLQRKMEQAAHQKEKIEQMNGALQHTEEEIEQLKYLLHEQAADANRKPRLVRKNEVKETFAYLSRLFDFLEHRLKRHFKYELVCEVICARYQFESRSHTPGREYLSCATILTYFKRERGMTDEAY